MFLDNEWNPVCNNGWDATDTGVACKQLGIGSSGLIRQFGQGSGVALIDNVTCIGNESMLINCDHTRTKILKTCNHVGVICNGIMPGKSI